MLVEEDPNFERRLDEVTAGLKSYIKTHLLERISRENAVTIVNYIQAFKAETNLADNYRESTIVTLKLLSEFPNRPVNEQKPFKAMTRDDILAFLNRLRKSNDVDPLHHWIGTYGNNVITINRFFKWLFYPLLKPSDRPRPEAIINVDKLDRKEKEIYKDSDLWLDPDCNMIVFKYVTSARNRAFHALMLDTSSRPKELINTKIKDLEFVDKGYSQRIAYLWVTGKSGKRIKKVLIKSLPYLRDWLAVHPRSQDPNAYILCGTGTRNIGRKLDRQTFGHIYIEYRTILFPSLLASAEVPDADKKIIKEKILTKPIRPYVLRHTSLTEKAEIMGEYQLRQHADWTITSNMPQRYIHFRGNESIKAQLKAQGIVSTNEDSSVKIIMASMANPVVCVNCNEQNKPDTHFCVKCGMILSFKAHTESMAEAENMKKTVAEMQTRQTAIERMFKKFIADEQDWNPKNPKEKKLIEETFERIMNPDSGFW